MVIIDSGAFSSEASLEMDIIGRSGIAHVKAYWREEMVGTRV